MIPITCYHWNKQEIHFRGQDHIDNSRRVIQVVSGDNDKL
ncbi:hypothetical protein DDI_2017 [Dickeya dianthicola RNS04.9]|nr:hypothetical protein DDI_2017 [Dickeya dianthicola RNS04.9]